VPGNGAALVIDADRGTSGGYPKIANVITADLGAFAQIPAGRGFDFKDSAGRGASEGRKFAQLHGTACPLASDDQAFVCFCSIASQNRGAARC